MTPDQATNRPLDPDRVLRDVRGEIREVLDDQYADEVARDLAEHVRLIDAWISGGGALPLAWIANDPRHGGSA